MRSLKIDSMYIDEHRNIFYISKLRCTENHIFFFQTLWKDGLSRKIAGIWSFLYYRERWYFFFPKIWSYSLGGKWKMIFFKKIHGNIFSSHILKRWSVQKLALEYDLSCIIWKDGIFPPENMTFFLWAENEGWSSSRNTWWHYVPLLKKIKHGLLPQKYT